MNAPTTQRAAPSAEGNVFERWSALRPEAGAPREPLTTGCVRATGACSCEACVAHEADARAIRAAVADALVECGVSKAAALFVRRGTLDDEALAIVRDECARVEETKSAPKRSVLLAWLGDLVAGRHDRIDRSAAAWDRADCVLCARAAFDVAALTCDRCAAEVVP
jgi:hypothetical protein